VRELSKRVLSG